MTAQAQSAISMENRVYRRRTRINRVMMALSTLALLFGLFWLVWIIATLLIEGASALRPWIFYR
ncbi:MAG TPA: phosphate ABC transporter permease PtsA, partial [Burkholderiales bacterium]|nr:phosphate ABC transporter permease PtsA [Burkholderiales bacterium]